MKKNLKILYIEDEVNDFIMLENELKKSKKDFTLKRSETENELINLLDEYNPDIVISDYSLPTFNGMAALKICKQLIPKIPFIVLTGSMNEDVAVECMKAGADDYVIKEHMTRINNAIDSAIEKRKLIIEKDINNKKLIESEKRLALALEGTNAGLWDRKIVTGEIYFCHRLMNLLGYAENEIPGVSLDFWKTTIHPDDYLMVCGLFEEHMKGNTERYEAEYRRFKKDGSIIWVLDRGKVVERDSAGNVLRAVGTMIDISEKKKIENDLIEAKLKAEEMNRLKTNFLANMSHEFRTPLNGIMGLAAILADDYEDKSKAKMSNEIIDSGKRLLNTLDSILEYAQLEVTKNEFEFKKISLNEIAVKAMSELEMLNQQKKVPIIFKETAQQIYVLGIEKYLRIIVYNLLENAVKFTDEGEIIFEISTVYEDDKNMALIKVSDTGIGIQKEHHQMIFQEFRQVSEGYGRSYEGAGLGLSLVKKLVQILNGSVSLQSNYGIGSTFRVRIPLASSAENKIGSSVNNKKVNVTDKRFKLLLIEDNSVNREVVELFLRNMCIVEYANTGEKGIELAKETQYSLIILDIHLGVGIDGTQTAKEIRKIPGYKNIPIIAVTGYAMHDDKDKLFAMGINYFLPKPFERAELIAIVKEAMGS